MPKVTKVDFVTKLKKKERVAAYTRVSCDKDTMLHSLSAQISYYSDLIQSNSEWEYAGVYTDEALSGTKDNRADFQRMVSDCKAGKIDRIITKSISRFARNTVTLLETVRMLKSIGVDVYFEEQNIHSMSADGELMLTILASYAQEESLSASENQKWRIKKLFEQGLPSSFSLYGYRKDNGNIVVYEPEAKVVREIFRLYLSGVGCPRIAKMQTEKGIPSPTGKEWCSQSVAEILKNEKYAGNMLLQKFYTNNHLDKTNKRNKGELPQYYVRNSHNSIVSTEEFKLVQNMIANKMPRTISLNEYDFKGKVFCGICGSRYARKNKHGKYVWRCHVYDNKGKDKCSSKQIPDNVIQDAVKAYEKDVARIIVLPENRLHFVFEDDSEKTISWELPSRSGSWTDEMKEYARQKTKSRHGGNE